MKMKMAKRNEEKKTKIIKASEKNSAYRIWRIIIERKKATGK